MSIYNCNNVGFVTTSFDSKRGLFLIPSRSYNGRDASRISSKNAIISSNYSGLDYPLIRNINCVIASPAILGTIYNNNKYK